MSAKDDTMMRNMFLHASYGGWFSGSFFPRMGWVGGMVVWVGILLPRMAGRLLTPQQRSVVRSALNQIEEGEGEGSSCFIACCCQVAKEWATLPSVCSICT
eukprot:6480067-Amphidinium_carterae.1